MGAAGYETSHRFFMPSVRDSWVRFFTALIADRASIRQR
jgi:hypothetical protein